MKHGAGRAESLTLIVLLVFNDKVQQIEGDSIQLARIPQIVVTILEVGIATIILVLVQVVNAVSPQAILEGISGNALADP
mmetsp:Transcript_44952/g.43531  ORF Transcript_44952/g.43531 Transcript_44952/m.43531 type:complete len:80 (-) Transcript_44952:365-604(-)